MDSVRFVGASPGWVAALEAAKRAAVTAEPLLLLGETGTGKEVVAQWVHACSGRGGAFVALNCAALAPSLVEGQLFGHVRGAFTGAEQDMPGLVEQAHGGTLFLDELGEMPLEIQPKLLRLLETRQVRRIGDHVERSVDARLVAATNQPLAELVAAGLFRADLYWRLNTFSVTLPPLRDRGEDLWLLAEYWLDAACAQLALPARYLSEAARQRLAEHSWPGNVRELRSVLLAACVAAGEAEEILPEHLPVLTELDEANESLLAHDVGEAGAHASAVAATGAHNASARESDVASTPPEVSGAAVNGPAEAATAAEQMRRIWHAPAPTAAQWASLLLALVEQNGGPKLARRHFVELLREARGNDGSGVSDSALVSDWQRNLKRVPLEAELLREEQRRLLVDVSRCRAVLAEQAAREAPASDSAVTRRRRRDTTLRRAITAGRTKDPPQANPSATASASVGASTTTRLERKRLVEPGGAAQSAPVSPGFAFVGRDAEWEVVLSHLAQPGTVRLVSLLGPGGVGKTRLARQVWQEVGANSGSASHVDATQATSRAGALASRDAIWVELAAARDADDLATAVARACGIPLDDAATPVERIAAALLARERPLLILDNLEQLAEAAAPVVARWLDAAPSLTVLVTSREPLQLPGEVELRLSPLALPEAEGGRSTALRDTPSVALFLTAARAARGGRELDDEALPAVARICRELEGLPLALELVAARCALLHPQQILERLERTVASARAAEGQRPSRHHTLADAIRWSFELLRDWERHALLELARFPGSFDAALAEDALDLSAFPEAPGALEALEQLRKKSLLEVGDEETPRPRCRLLAPVREFARQRLGEHEDEDDDAGAEQASQRAWVRRVGEVLSQRLATRRLDPAVAAVAADVTATEAELPTWRLLLEDALSTGEIHQAAQWALALDGVYALRGPNSERVAWLERLREAEAGAVLEPGLHARVLVALGNAYQMGGNAAAEETLRAAHASAERAQQPETAALALAAWGHLLANRRDPQAGATLEQAIQAFAALAPATPVHEAHLATLRATLASDRGDWQGAMQQEAAAHAAWRTADNPVGLVRAGARRASHLVRLGRFAEAVAQLPEVAEQAEAVGDTRTQAHALSALAVAQLQHGEIATGLETCRRGDALAQRIGDANKRLVFLSTQAHLATKLGALEEAFAALDAAERLGRALPQAPNLVVTIGTRGVLLLHANQAADARVYLQQALELDEGRLAPKDRLAYRIYLAQAHLAVHEPAAALAELDLIREELADLAEPQPQVKAEALWIQAKLALGEPDGIAPRLEQRLAAWQRTPPPDERETVEFLCAAIAYEQQYGSPERLPALHEQATNVAARADLRPDHTDPLKRLTVPPLT